MSFTNCNSEATQSCLCGFGTRCQAFVLSLNLFKEHKMNWLCFILICGQGKKVEIALDYIVVCDEITALLQPMEVNTFPKSSYGIFSARSSLCFFIVFEILLVNPLNRLANLLKIFFELYRRGSSLSNNAKSKDNALCQTLMLSSSFREDVNIQRESHWSTFIKESLRSKFHAIIQKTNSINKFVVFLTFITC